MCASAAFVRSSVSSDMHQQMLREGVMSGEVGADGSSRSRPCRGESAPPRRELVSPTHSRVVSSEAFLLFSTGGTSLCTVAGLAVDAREFEHLAEQRFGEAVDADDTVLQRHDRSGIARFRRGVGLASAPPYPNA